MSRIIIAGDRNWNDRQTMEDYINQLSVDTVIIEGDCRGADKMAGDIALKRGMTVVKFPADWSMGRKAGPIRNRKMLEQNPDRLVIFHNNIENSKGSKNVRNQALKKNIDVEVVTSGGK